MNVLHVNLKKQIKGLKSFKPLLLNISCFLLGFFSFYLLSLVIHQDQRIIDIANSSQETTEVKLGDLGNCNIYVDVSGAVNYPGVYCLNSGSRLIDVINKAKGFNKLYAQRYVEQKINLSALIEENQKIYVPYLNDMSCEIRNFSYEVKGVNTSQGSNNQSNGGSGSSCVSINDGTLAQLNTLKGIGDSIAQRIIDARPYKSINDLKNVSGIGDKVFDNIKSSVCL
ncbi:MAG TPA: helix-hairpin-helix domain-containing protein [Candidatus Dojkabacteria bacterium]|nr:helix-hairpin-helix domain-containing protein [Candidatus Dojkabacteria bacterium]